MNDEIRIEPVGTSAVRPRGLTGAERLRRIAAAQGLAGAGTHGGDRPLAHLVFGFDPLWLRFDADARRERRLRNGDSIRARDRAVWKPL